MLVQVYNMWFNISIHCKPITKINIVTICHQSYYNIIDYISIAIHFISVTCLFYYWKFVPLNFPHLFYLSSYLPLAIPCLFPVSISLFLFCYIHIFKFHV